MKWFYLLWFVNLISVGPFDRAADCTAAAQADPRIGKNDSYPLLYRQGKADTVCFQGYVAPENRSGIFLSGDDADGAVKR